MSGQDMPRMDEVTDALLRDLTIDYSIGQKVFNHACYFCPARNMSQYQLIQHTVACHDGYDVTKMTKKTLKKSLHVFQKYFPIYSVYAVKIADAMHQMCYSARCNKM